MLGVVLLASCGLGGAMTSRIKMDGSSTVYPVSQAMAEEFQYETDDVEVAVGVSGTGGGFEKFCNGEISITNASRPIRESEAEACEAAGIGFIEIPVAWDGIAVVVNPANDWAQCLTMAELQAMWAPEAESKVTSWSDVRDTFPDTDMNLYGPGTDSGTYDYFTEAVVGSSGASRGDYTASEDDNVLVQGVAGDRGAIGFFGFAYYEENQHLLKLVGVDAGQGCVEPSEASINDGTYPLSRPIFIYVSAEAAKDASMQEFIEFYLSEAEEIVPAVGFVALDQHLYDIFLARFEAGRTGSAMQEGAAIDGITVDDLLFDDEKELLS